MDVSLKFDIMQLLFILTLINAATHSMAKGIKHDVTHAKDQLSDATSGATNGSSIFNSYFISFLLFDGRRKTHSPSTNTSTQPCILVLTLCAFPSTWMIFQFDLVFFDEMNA